MKKLRPDKRQKIVVLTLIAFMFLGFGIRIVTCYWGYPYHLHPDEPTIVTNAIDMISRHSWEANVYNRPDHFEIKCCAILFQIVSFLKYHVSADVAFAEHEMAFYLLARGYTAFFGTLMIPLAYLILEKCKKGSGIVGAGLTTLFTIFVSHSALSTPDIVLTFMVMLVAYISILYLENPSVGKVIAMSIVAGLGITIKYTCAICCLWIAFVVILECVRQKDCLKIIKYGMIAILVVLFTCFFMAPNLFTNIRQTLAILKTEARSTHLGADGLGRLGNFKYYFTTFLNAVGWDALPFMILGIVYAIRSKIKANISLGLGLLFWICTSVLALHWERWGMPIYIFYMFVIALGMREALDLINKRLKSSAKKFSWKFIVKAVLILWIVVIFVNASVSTISMVIDRLSADTRITALVYCNENGITKENSLYDGYTPFAMNDLETISVSLDDEGKIQLTEEQAGVTYIILSSNMYNRYYAEPERYTLQVEMYDAIREQCELLCQFVPYGCKTSQWSVQNIILRMKYIFGNNNVYASGYTIQIYKIAD